MRLSVFLMLAMLCLDCHMRDAGPEDRADYQQSIGNRTGSIE